ncbi:Holliday junction resolvase RecU [Clostridium ihumii]|uniref:Holliday junction resolvase RecU n=1 Tax=Clostridium ihumii TaxID=1470356 RepID=UPI000553B7BE|nr:Holliday junction resolvase RecU [Clostridium ihumii]
MRVSECREYQNTVNNAQGHLFEAYITAGCNYYKRKGLAVIEKTPEPFRVMKKSNNGTFMGRFTANAQPDFKGTLAGGQAIVFEAKYTSTLKMRRAALTDTQMECLEEHERMGAKTGVCICIKDVYAFIPWTIWKDMKKIYGRQYLTAQDVDKYKIKIGDCAFFLDYVKEGEM